MAQALARSGQHLEIVSDVRLAQATDWSGICFEPRTELIAAIQADAIDIYRLGGQRAFHLEAETLSGRPTCLSWTNDGEILLIGTDSGHVDSLVTKEYKSSSVRRQTTTSPQSKHGAVVGLGSLSINLDGSSEHTSKRLEVDGRPQTGDTPGLQSVIEWLRDLQVGGDGGPPRDSMMLKGLPQYLAQLNPADVLPRLSAIPPPSRAGPGMPVPKIKTIAPNVHPTQIRSTSQSPNMTEVSFVSHEDESVVGSVAGLLQHQFRSPTNVSSSDLVTARDASRGVYVTTARQTPELENGRDDSLVKLRLYQAPFSETTSLHSGIILHNAACIHHLQLYVEQCIETVVTDWNTLTTLPTKLTSIINETLTEKNEGSLDQHLYQLLMTGNCSPTVTEWLKDDLTDRGHKRWDQAMTTFYHAVTHILEINLIPALEQCALAASTLRGLATYHEGSSRFSVPPSLYSGIIDSLSCLKLLAHEALQILGSEGRAFKAFSPWLRIQVDLATSEAGSQAATELYEKEATTTNVLKVKSYIEGPFNNSRLVPIMGRRLSAMELDAAVTSTDQSPSHVGSMIAQSRLDNKTAEQDMLYLPLHLLRLKKQVESCSAAMQKWQSTTWQQPIEVDVMTPGMSSGIAIRILDTSADSHGCCLLSLVGRKGKSGGTVIYHRMSVTKLSTQSTKHSTITTATTIALPADYTILDAKPLADGSLLILSRTNTDESDSTSEHSLIAISESSLVSSSNAARSVSLQVQEIQECTLHHFEDDRSFVPAHLMVSDSHERKSVLVLDDSRVRSKVLRLPRNRLGSKVNGNSQMGAKQSPFGIVDDGAMLID